MPDRVQFPSARGEPLVGRFERPAGERIGVALLAHCFTCGKDLLGARLISRALAARGYAVLRFDFTGLGESAGDFADTTFTSNVEDLVAAAAWLGRTEGAPALLVGHSLGGPAVILAAHRLAEVRAVATIGAPSDPAHVAHLFADALPRIEGEGEARVYLAGRPFTVSRRFLEDVREQRMAEAVRGLDRALLVLHSPQDSTVAVEHAARLYAAARHPKSFISLDGADHLLSRPADAAYVGEIVAAWASRYV